MPHSGQAIDTAVVDGTQTREVEDELPRVLRESHLDTVAERVDPVRVEVSGELQMHVVFRVHREDREIGWTRAGPTMGADAKPTNFGFDTRLCPRRLRKLSATSSHISGQTVRHGFDLERPVEARDLEDPPARY